MIKYTKNFFLISIILLYTIFSNFSIVFGKDSLYTSYDLGFPTVSRNIAIIDKDSKLILYEKRGFDKVYPASTTKIMTALLLIENTENLDTEKIYFTKDAVENLEVNASVAGLNDGDSLLAKDALYALLLPSANDVANAIAIHISGSVEAFGELMTKRAKELGCENTNFTNPSGLHDDNHYSTAYDMALIMAEISKYDVFLEVSKAPSYDIPPTETEEKVRTVNNTNRLVLETSAYYDEDVLASKTGYTSKAEYTLVTYGERDNTDIIVSTMYSTNYDRFEDTSKLLDFTFDSYIDTTKNTIALPTYFEDSQKTLYSDVPVKDLIINIPDKISLDDLDYVTNIVEPLKAPISEGTTIGSLDVYYQDTLLDTFDLVTDENLNYFLNLEKNTGLSSLSYLDSGIQVVPMILTTIIAILIALFVVIVGLFIYGHLFHKRRRRRRLANHRKIKR